MNNHWPTKTYAEYKKAEDKIHFLKFGDNIDAVLAEFLVGKELYGAAGIVQSDIPSDILGDDRPYVGIYETVVRSSTTEPWMYAGECEKGEKVNRSPDHALKVFVCSKYRDKDIANQIRNILAARDLCEEIIQNEGNLPIAPHLYLPQILDDANPISRDIGINYGLALLDSCDAMMVLISDPDKPIEENLSAGMKAEVEHAVTRGMQPTYVFKTEDGFKFLEE